MKKLMASISILFFILSCNSNNEKLTKQDKETILLLSYNKKLWPNKTIPYVFDKSITESMRTRILNCMNTYTNKSEIIFQDTSSNSINLMATPVSISKDFNLYENGFSSIGYAIFPRIILGEFASDKVIFHELGHIIGLDHEHQRPDRDNYIIVHFENIAPRGMLQYIIVSNFLYDYTKYEYDYNSIMHYEAFDYSNNSSFKPTIENKKNPSSQMFSSSSPTDLDYQKIRDMYSNK